MNFVSQLATAVSQLSASSSGGTAIGWAGDSTDVTKGLRVTILGFNCASQQSVPITQVIGINIDTADKLASSLAWALDNIVPDGGTCPHQAIDDAVFDVQNNDLLTRPYKSAIIITDGVRFLYFLLTKSCGEFTFFPPLGRRFGMITLYRTRLRWALITFAYRALPWVFLVASTERASLKARRRKPNYFSLSVLFPQTFSTLVLRALLSWVILHKPWPISFPTLLPLMIALPRSPQILIGAAL